MTLTIILNDNTEIIVSDEQYSDSYTKIRKMDLGYYKDGEHQELEDYLIVADRSSSIVEQNISFSDEMNSSLSALNTMSYKADFEFSSSTIKQTIDIYPYTYKQTTSRVTKTKEEVYQDALDFLELAQSICNGNSYCYYRNIDVYTARGDFEEYYSGESYVYYPNYEYNTRVYLYAIYQGDYQFTSKDPRDYTKDDVTTR